MTFDLKIKGSWVKIYIDNILHVQFKQQDFEGIQSWKEGPNWFDIEYYIKNRSMLTAYDDVNKWKEILKLIDERL